MRQNLFRHDLFAFFHDDGALIAFREFADRLIGQGPCHAELENARFRKRFPRVLEGGSGADDAEIGFFRAEDLMQIGFFIPLRKRLHVVDQSDMRSLGKRGDHDTLSDGAAVVSGCGSFFGFPAVHDAAGVADARGHAEHRRYMELLGKFKRPDREIVGFLTVGRLEHGHLGGNRVKTVVLFVLAGRHARVVGGYEEKPAFDADIGQSEQRIGGDIDSDVLHCNNRFCTGERDSGGDFHCHFFIRRPFCIAADGGEMFKNLCRGSAGISGSEFHSAGKSRLGDRFVAAEDNTLFSHNISPVIYFSKTVI